MSAFGALSAVITEIKVVFYKIIDELTLAGAPVFPNIGLFAVP
jgi:hypothetical protein